MSDYTPPVGQSNYNSGWGNNQAKETALKIDHIADKAKFGIEMLGTGLIGIDAIEKELIELSQAPQPPSQVQVRSLAHRLDSHQKQLQQGLDRIKEMMNEIDRETDAIQRPRSGW
ncbi:hypothetical protein PAECIP111893_01420 [Paenibacillus plantiphilus]|uniref:Uncharacterized protein n=1 Tax=Paenibacillus plantiphilus TaxID=2905650 RepID=A0ABM9C305_9BACL|nr:hypothetical protein [Paenibacillus plantiphilus]CAH1200532.1 hypothetical protein PAECIP111893_01420 [Paenibacillus plantiphilus]